MSEQFTLSHQLVAVYNGCYSGPNIPAKIVQNDGTLRVVKVPTGEELFPVSRWHRKDKKGELFALCRYEIAETFVQRLAVQKREAVVAFLQDTSEVQLRLNENEKNPARPYGIRLYLAQENRFRNPAAFNLSLDYHNPAFYWSFTAELVGSLEREPAVWNAWFEKIQTYYNTTKFTPDITAWELEVFKGLGILIGNFTKYGVATVIANYADTDPKTGQRRFNPEKLKQYAREKRELERQRFYPEDQGEVLQAFPKVIADLAPFLFAKDVVVSILAEFEQENKQIEQENNRQAALRAAREAERKAKEAGTAQSTPTRSRERTHQRVVSASALRRDTRFSGIPSYDPKTTGAGFARIDPKLNEAEFLSCFACYQDQRTGQLFLVMVSNVMGVLLLFDKGKAIILEERALPERVNEQIVYYRVPRVVTSITNGLREVFTFVKQLHISEFMRFYDDIPADHIVIDHKDVRDAARYFFERGTIPRVYPLPSNTFPDPFIASVVARQLAQEHGIDLRFIKGTGPSGSIVQDDVAASLTAQRERENAAGLPATATPSATDSLLPAAQEQQPRTNATFLGHEVRDGVKTREEVWLADAALSRGMYLVGKPGTAKSTLFINRILQDIDKGIGVCFVDPTGEAIKDLIVRIPEERIRSSDVLLIDPLHDDYCFGWNPYECKKPKDRRMVLEASRRAMHMYQLLYADKQTGNLGVLVDQYLRTSAHTLIQNGLTMAELPLLFTNEQVRSKLLANVTNSKVLTFWEDEYNPLPEHEKREMCRMALNKVDRFLENDFSASIVGQTSTTIDFRGMINEGKILLVKLSNRPVYKELSRLVGAVIIAELLNAALSRGDILDMSQRRQFNIYTDEFHEFATADWSELIEQARKYKVGTTFGHQRRSQLVDAAAREGVLVTRNLAVGSISGKDAEEVAKEFDCTPSSVKPPPVPDVLGYLLHKGRHPDERVNAFVHKVTGVMGRDHAMLPLLSTVLSLAQFTPKEALLAALPETQKATFLWYFLRALPADLYFHELPPAQFDPRLDKRPDYFLTSVLSEPPEEARRRALRELEQRTRQDTAATDGREAERLLRHKAAEANVQTAERLLLQMFLTADNPNGQAFQAAAAAFEWLIRPHFFERQTWKRDPSPVEYRPQTELRSSPYHYTTPYPSVVVKDTYARNVLARFPFLSIDRNRTEYKLRSIVLADKEFRRIVEEKFQDEKRFTEKYLRDFAQVLSILASEPITEGSRPHEQPLTFADMANKIANDLKNLPDFHFRCILQEGGRAVERTIAIPPLTGGVDEAEYAKRMRIIDENTFLAGCYRKREEVEEEIRQRQVRWRKPPEREPQPGRGQVPPPEDEPPPMRDSV